MIKIRIFALCAFLCSACGASSVSQLKSNPAYSESVTSKYGYQESLRIVKDEYVALAVGNLSCTVFPDLKMGECALTGPTGIISVATSKPLDENSARVEFYAAVATSYWKDNIRNMVKKLR